MRLLVSFRLVPDRSGSAVFALVLGGVSSKDVVPIFMLEEVSQ